MVARFYPGQKDYIQQLNNLEASIDTAVGDSINAWAAVQENVSVVSFGAERNGSTDDMPAVQIMAASLGYVKFTAGNYLLSTGTIDVPIVFDAGAYLTVPAGNTLTIKASVDSPRQWVFRGDGTYVMTTGTDRGENSRQVHASWFGVFPTNGANTDQAPRMNAMFTSLGNLRESDVEFDMGSYKIGSAVYVPRACRVRGRGSRRTVFDPLSDGFDAFVTTGSAVRFEGIHFETPGGVTRTNGAFIRIDHGECDIRDVWMGRSKQGIVVAGGNCRISDIAAVYGEYPGAGSSLVSIQSNGCEIDGVMLGTSAAGPDAIVEVGGASASNLGNFAVRNVRWTTPSIGVLVNPTNISVSRGIITGLRYAGLSGTNAPWLVKTLTSGTGGIEKIQISHVAGSSLANGGICFENASSGITEDITVSHVSDAGTTGVGVSFVQTSGTLRDIRIADTVDVADRETPYSYTGTPTKIRIAPHAETTNYPAVCYDATIADDSVFSINLRRTLFTGAIIVTAGATNYGMYAVRAATSPAINAMTTPTAAMSTTTGALTGTTGTDGKLTVSVDHQMIYVENRLGSTQRVCVSVLGGIS